MDMKIQEPFAKNTINERLESLKGEVEKIRTEIASNLAFYRDLVDDTREIMRDDHLVGLFRQYFRACCNVHTELIYLDQIHPEGDKYLENNRRMMKKHDKAAKVLAGLDVRLTSSKKEQEINTAIGILQAISDLDNTPRNAIQNWRIPLYLTKLKGEAKRVKRLCSVNSINKTISEFQKMCTSKPSLFYNDRNLTHNFEKTIEKMQNYCRNIYEVETKPDETKVKQFSINDIVGTKGKKSNKQGKRGLDERLQENEDIDRILETMIEGLNEVLRILSQYDEYYKVTPDIANIINIIRVYRQSRIIMVDPEFEEEIKKEKAYQEKQENIEKLADLMFEEYLAISNEQNNKRAELVNQQRELIQSKRIDSKGVKRAEMLAKRKFADYKKYRDVKEVRVFPNQKIDIANVNLDELETYLKSFGPAISDKITSMDNELSVQMLLNGKFSKQGAYEEERRKKLISLYHELQQLDARNRAAAEAKIAGNNRKDMDKFDVSENQPIKIDLPSPKDVAQEYGFPSISVEGLNDDQKARVISFLNQTERMAVLEGLNNRIWYYINQRKVTSRKEREAMRGMLLNQYKIPALVEAAIAKQRAFEDLYDLPEEQFKRTL